MFGLALLAGGSLDNHSVGCYVRRKALFANLASSGLAAHRGVWLAIRTKLRRDGFTDRLVCFVAI